MIELVTLEELRQTRRKLAEEQGDDPHRYAAMLAEVSRTLPGTYVKQPLLPQVPTEEGNAKAS
jgi:hypothetical protein